MEDFLRKLPFKTYKKGEIVVFQGEAPRQAFVVKSGVIKSYNLSVNGDEKPIGFLGAGMVFPDSWVYEQTPSAVYYYEVQSDEAQLYLVSRDKYLAFVERHPSELLQTLRWYVSENLGQAMRLNALQHSRATDKLLYTLHYLALTNGKKVAPHTMSITLSLTHQELANLTGLTRETTATELNKLKASGVINYGKHVPYTIYLDKLARMLHDEYITDLEKQHGL